MRRLYSKGNTAKQWIFEELDDLFGERDGRILDFCCGAAKIWKPFLEAHPHLTYQGIDFDRKAIMDAQKYYRSKEDRVSFSFGDAQMDTLVPADAVTAFSAIEHVYDRVAFLKNVFQSLKSGGRAYLNYDAGHFRSRDLKERLMVPVSQILARVSIQGPYMKQVDDQLLKHQAESLGFRIINTRKHNISCLKGFFKHKSDEAIWTWYDFEERIGSLYQPDDLDKAFLSTTLVVEKP